MTTSPGLRTARLGAASLPYRRPRPLPHTLNQRSPPGSVDGLPTRLLSRALGAIRD